MSTTTDKLFAALYQKTASGKLRWERTIDDGFMASTPNYAFVVSEGSVVLHSGTGTAVGIVRAGENDVGKLLKLIAERTHYASDDDVAKALKELEK